MTELIEMKEINKSFSNVKVLSNVSFSLLFVLRYLLGVVESAVMPAALVFLSHWFTKEERSRANTFLILGNPVTVLWMSVISGYLVQALNWRWMFVIEGLPAVIWAFFWSVPSRSTVPICWAQATSGFLTRCLLLQAGRCTHHMALSLRLCRKYSRKTWGSFVGTYVVGYLNGATGSPNASYVFMAGSLVFSVIFTMAVKKPEVNRVQHSEIAEVKAQ